LYPVATNGRTYYRSASTLAEAGNSTLLGARKHGPAMALLIVIEQDATRISNHQMQAQQSNPDHVITPKAGFGHLRKIQADATKFDDPIFHYPPSKAWVTVTPRSNLSKSCDTFLMKDGGKCQDCTCGVSKQQRKPCWHEVLAATTIEGFSNTILQNGKEKTLFGECYSISEWKKQYTNIGIISPLSQNEVKEMPVLNNTRVPTFGKRPKGRPSDKKRKKGAIDLFKDYGEKKRQQRAEKVLNLSQLSQGTDL
jgi:hypothetical protein